MEALTAHIAQAGGVRPPHTVGIGGMGSWAWICLWQTDASSCGLWTHVGDGQSYELRVTYRNAACVEYLDVEARRTSHSYGGQAGEHRRLFWANDHRGGSDAARALERAWAWLSDAGAPPPPWETRP